MKFKVGSASSSSVKPIIIIRSHTEMKASRSIRMEAVLMVSHRIRLLFGKIARIERKKEIISSSYSILGIGIVRCALFV